VPYKEKKIEKKYFSIGEVAATFQVAPSLIRFWEKEFSILKPQKNRKGNRQYTVADIENFRRIYHLVKEKGYTLQGAKEHLKEASRKEVEPEKKDTSEIVQSLVRLKGFLTELKDKL
jgi:DNA-binding transcriptional MerR regulator